MKTNYVLWTSGWDSTIRILELLLLKKEVVQPIYIIDKNRKSLNNELIAIERIQNRIAEKYPETKDIFLPIKFIKKNNIKEDSSITEAYKHIASIRKIGSQYEWLAQFCKDNNLSKIEISIEKNTKIDSFSNFIVKYHISKQELQPDEIKIKESLFTIFNYFEFPVIYKTKIEMAAISDLNDWNEIMNLTWFCHKQKNGKPCGKCNPCIATIEKGLGYRIPLTNRILGYIKIYKNKLKW
jgi:7-cyano-7-deazaguanine synthase in queuosine biosynthesis